MGLGEHTITNWDGMRKVFLRKYQPYCRSKDSKDDIFRMTQQEDETLEEYLERFIYNLQKSKHRTMPLELTRTIFLKGIREEYMDDLNLMGKGDISVLPFEEIADLCEKYSRSKAKMGKRTLSSKATKSNSTSVTRAEIGNLLEELKTDLLSTIGNQIDTLKTKKKQEAEDQVMSIFCPKCRKKHALKDCPLDSIQFCAFCTEHHDIFNCPKVKVLQNYNMAANAEMENICMCRIHGMYQCHGSPKTTHSNNGDHLNSILNLILHILSHIHRINNHTKSHPQPYQQYPQQAVYPPQPTQQALPAPPPINPPQLQFLANSQPSRPTQIPAQTIPNPNNRAERPTYNIEEGTSYSTLPLQNINLRSGKVLQKESPITDRREENIENEKEITNQKKSNNDISDKKMQQLNPPFPDQLVHIKPPLSIPQFDVLDELKNVYIKIPLLQAIKDIPIYTKAIKDMCLKKPARRRIDPQTIHVIGHLAGLMTNTISIEKYVDPGIPKVTTIINNIQIPNTLIDLGAAINVMTLETMRTLQLTNLQHTTIVLELADRSKVIPEGILEDIIVSLDSWEYPVDFLVLQPKSNLGGHPIILDRPWLATADAFIGRQSGNMIISRGTERKQLTLYPSAQSPAVTHNLWLDDKFNDKNEVQPLFSIDQIYNFQEHDNNDLVELFLAQPDISENLRHDQYHAADILLAQNFQETCTIHSLQTTFHDIFPVQSITNTQSKVIEISPGKTLNIGNHLDSSQQERLIQLLRKYQKAFAWDYTDIHFIYVCIIFTLWF
eukprot:PITA_26627